MSNYEIETIIKNKKISSYLDSKGIFPVKEIGDKIYYKCPIHEGDNDPSFIVYKKDEGEDYYCFGCKSGVSIINLYAALEKCSIGKSIYELSKGLNLSVKDKIDFLIQEVNQISKNTNLNKNQDEIYDMVLFLNSCLFDFMNKVDKDEEEIKRCEKIFKLIDSYLYSNDYDKINEMSKEIQNVLNLRYNIYINNKNNKEIENIKESLAYDNIQ